MTTKDTVRSFIVTELGFSGGPDELGDDYPLLEREVIDSLGLMKLVTYLESEMDIEIDDEDLVPDHFGTIGDIADLIAAKKG